MSNWQGSIAKMHTVHESTVQYYLPCGDAKIHLNPYIGKRLTLVHNQQITCIHCQRLTKKSFSQGYCYPCFRSLARCDQCIIKPELCHYHQGTCREPSWGEAHCLKPHIIYLANSSGLKVGITRQTQVPTRWIDQGAIAALPLFTVDQRLDSGVIEVALKRYIADKTNWRKMLKNDVEPKDLYLARDELFGQAEQALEQALSQVSGYAYCDSAKVLKFCYPVTRYPEKVTSLSLDKTNSVSGVLEGIKGQYLLFDHGVMNVRKFAGYNVNITVEE
jgi:hypothetical protein